MFRHSSFRVPYQDHQHQRWIRKVRESTNKIKRGITNKEEQKTSGHESRDPETLETRLLGEILSTADIVNENKDSEMQLVFQKKSNRQYQYTADLVKSLAGEQTYKKRMPK